MVKNVHVAGKRDTPPSYFILTVGQPDVL